RHHIAFDQIEAAFDKPGFLMVAVVKINVANAKFEGEIGNVGGGGSIDYPGPCDRTEALLTHGHTKTEVAVGLNPDCGIMLAEHRIGGIEVLARIIAAPKLSLPARLVELLAKRLS